MSDDLLSRLRELCLSFPEVSERLSHGAPSFFIRGKKTLAMFHDGHHGDGRISVWCPAPDGAQPAMVDMHPERFFVPPYVGPRGWIGVYLDDDPDWDEVREILEVAYRKVAPKKLVQLLEVDG